MLYVLNYADGQPYQKFQQYCNFSAKFIGKADSVISFNKDDIPQSYKDAHQDIFSYERGGGLWLWKPYLVNKALLSLEKGDWLFYTDSGSIFINDIHLLIDFCIKKETDIMLFDQPLLNRQFCKCETFKQIGVDDNNETQTLGIFLLKKTKFTISFMQEWLHYCEQETVISPKHFFSDIPEFNDFHAHREDQAILSLLGIKYSLPRFRDCSDYGLFPFQYKNPKWTYVPKEYDFDDYPTILLCSRKTHPIKYLFFYYIKKYLNKLGLYTEKYMDKKFQV